MHGHWPRGLADSHCFLLSCFPPPSLLDKHPLTSPLDKLVQQHGQVLQNEPADVERKELRGVPRAELEADLRLILVPETGVFNLSGDLVW